MDRHPGIPTPSQTYDARERRIEWPPDGFTRAVTADASSEAPWAPSTAVTPATPAASSYAADDNMETFDALPPYVTGTAAEIDLARYTGAV